EVIIIFLLCWYSDMWNEIVFIKLLLEILN
ncbi:hypothetical protein MP638_000361, partial [Amoeboaphelidium occidentale]